MTQNHQTHEVINVGDWAAATCKWFGSGYGFFDVHDGGKDVFAHVTLLKESGFKRPREGDTCDIQFGVRSDDSSKREAVAVRGLKKAA